MQALLNLLRRSKVIVAIVVVLIIGYFIYFYVSLSTTTDNAYVMANSQPIAAEVSGKVEKVYVTNNQAVTKGTLLFTLDTSAYQIKLKQATLSVEAATAEVEGAQIALNNFTHGDLLQQNITKLDELKVALKIAQIKQQQAQLMLKIAQSQLKATEVYAPADGIVSNLSLSEGMLINAYQPLFAFIDSSHWWVQANFKETDLADVKKGDKATIRLRMYLGDKIYQGRVENTNWAVARSYKQAGDLQQVPQENQWLLLPQRFPVLISIDNPDPKYPLHVGASAYVTLQTSE